MGDGGGDRWERFWATQSTPLNRSEDKGHRDRYGAELRLLFAPAPRRVLEHGCGSGALFEPLGFDGAERYLGVDFSQSMLDAFAEIHPDVDLVQGRAESFQVDETFDLIFSSAVGQFLDRGQLRDHLAASARMLAPGGQLVLAANPWRRMRWAYSRGDLAGGARRPFPIALAYYGKRFWNDPMGQWHDTHTVEAIANHLDLDVAFYGSLLYPYRFHAVLEESR